MGILFRYAYELTQDYSERSIVGRKINTEMPGKEIVMKKNLIKTMTAAALAGLLTMTAGYGVCAAEETSAAPQGQEEAELKTIGEKAEGETIFAVKLTNSTGKNITGLAVKGAKEAAYPENMLEEGDVFGQDEERVLYYDSAAVLEAVEAENEGDEIRPLVRPIYNIQVTFDDETVQELHSFPFGDAEEAVLCQGEEVLYITYVSLSAGTEFNTEEAELMDKQLAEETSFEPEEVIYDQSQIVYDVPVYEEPAVQQPAVQEPAAQEPAAQEPAAQEPAAQEPAAQEPAAQEPVAQEPVVQEPVVQEPVVQEPVVQEPAAPAPAFEPVYMDPAGDGGCVTDGLTY